MSHVSLSDNGANAQFIMGDVPSIEFSDPSYAKATSILLNPEDCTVHAVLHEGVFLIGQAPACFFEKAKCLDDIDLSADLSNGSKVHLTASVGMFLTKDNVNAKELMEETKGALIEDQVMPTASSGGFAMTSVVRS